MEVKPELESINCPFCDNDESNFWATENGYVAVKCVHCGFVYVNPRPTLECINQAIENGEYDAEGRKLHSIRAFNRIRVNALRERLLTLFSNQELKEHKIRWLDVGAGNGELLFALTEITGEQSIIKGIEPCIQKRERAMEYGLHVTEERISEITERYDYISLINVFSHLPNPKDFIVEIRKRLASRGELILVTGNAGDIKPNEIPGKLFLPNHLVFAGERHIREIIELAGLEIIKLQKYRRFIPEYFLFSIAKVIFNKHLLLSRGSFRFLWIRARSVI